jgi:hypothetical protein
MRLFYRNASFRTVSISPNKKEPSAEGEKLYFLSDAVVENSRELYAKTLFSVVNTKDYRAFGITYKDSGKGKAGSFQKKGTLYKMISAGSVLIVSDTDEVMKLFNNHNAEKIGLNQIVK